MVEALELVRLGGYERRRTWELSGGQQQRVALARALVNRPTVLLLDEPLGALDLKLRKQMQLELKALQREVGITFVYVTHDQEEALTMSDVIVVMLDGLIQQLGARGAVRAAGQPLRRELHRRLQPAPGTDHVVRQRPPTRRGRDRAWAAASRHMSLIRRRRRPTSRAATVAVRPERLDRRAYGIGDGR